MTHYKGYYANKGRERYLKLSKGRSRYARYYVITNGEERIVFDTMIQMVKHFGYAESTIRYHIKYKIPLQGYMIEKVYE